MDPLRESSGSEAGLAGRILSTDSLQLNAETALDHRGDFDPECAELLHGLNNALVGMLLNAQVLEWKLPSYSRLKRNLHEIERNAQCGGELVKRLLKRLAIPQQEQSTGGQYGAEAASLDQAAFALASPEAGGEPLMKAPSRESRSPLINSFACRE